MGLLGFNGVSLAKDVHPTKVLTTTWLCKAILLCQADVIRIQHDKAPVGIWPFGVQGHAELWRHRHADAQTGKTARLQQNLKLRLMLPVHHDDGVPGVEHAGTPLGLALSGCRGIGKNAECKTQTDKQRHTHTHTHTQAHTHTGTHTDQPERNRT